MSQKQVPKCSSRNFLDNLYSTPCQSPALDAEGFVVCFEHLTKDAALVKIRLLQKELKVLRAKTSKP